jgi:hypothetical protein
MESRLDQEVKQQFDKLFKSVGGGMPWNEYEHSISQLGSVLPEVLGLDDVRVYCGTVVNFSMSIWVAKDQGIYFIGISAGLEKFTQISIRNALRKLASGGLIHRSTIDELERLLSMYALAFVMGHECGHITFGHIDREVTVVQRVGEISLKTTNLEEAHADMLGVMSMMTLKDAVYRMRDLSTEFTAVALLQLPILCVLNLLKRPDKPTKITGQIIRLIRPLQGIFKTARQPQEENENSRLIVRLLVSADMLMEVAPFLFSKKHFNDNKRMARKLLSLIVPAVSPQLDKFVGANVQQLADASKVLSDTVRPSFVEWFKKGLWLSSQAHRLRSELSTAETDPDRDESRDAAKASSNLAGFEFDSVRMQRFNKLFESVGGGIAGTTEYDRAIEVFAGTLANILGIQVKAIYCGILRNSTVNAFVVKDQGEYFIGISHGISSGVANSTGAALGKLALQKLVPHSAIEEMQRILGLYALVYAIGHECGHIALGHIDRELALVQMAGETSMSSTYLEEAQADMIGAFAMIAMKDGIYRMRDLTDESTAIGLLQLSVLCVMSEFRKATGKVKADSGYPHPISRLMLVGQVLTEIVSSLFDQDNYRENYQKAQELLNPIFEAVAPEMDVFLRANSEELGSATRSLFGLLKPLFDEWQTRGLWLVFDTPEFRAKVRSSESRPG